MNIRDDHIELYYPVRLPMPIQQQALGNNERRRQLVTKIDILAVPTYFIAGYFSYLRARAVHDLFHQSIGVVFMGLALAEASRLLIPLPKAMSPIARTFTYLVCGTIELMMLEYLSKKFFH